MYKAKFRLVSPLRIDCFLQPGVEFREKHGTRVFWESVAADINATHVRKASDGVRHEYEHSHRDDVANDIDVLRAEIPLHATLLDTGDHCVEVTRVEWRLCDFGILLADISLTIDVGGQSAADLERKVQDVARRLCESVIKDSYEKLRSEIRSRDDHELFVSFDGNVTFEMGWTSRALLFDPDNYAAREQQRNFAEQWLGNGSDTAKGLVEQLERAEIDRVADWMNYVYQEKTPENSSRVQQHWEALMRAQFYYAAMARIDSSLMDILSWAMSDTGEVSTSKLRIQLRRAMNFAEALFLKKAEVGKYVTPSSRIETERILEVWDFEDVLVKPVRMKLEICQTRLDNIDQERARSANFFTDLILMVIGVTSILGTALAVVGLGRSTATDPNQAMYDLGAGDLTSWIAAQPVDVILLISTIVSVLMVIAFILARRSSET